MALTICVTYTPGLVCTSAGPVIWTNHSNTREYHFVEVGHRSLKKRWVPQRMKGEEREVKDGVGA